MPRTPPHFKVRTTIANHEKMAAVYADDHLLAVWTRLGVLAIERYADRTDDSFRIHDRELAHITGKGRADIARKSLQRLADVSPISAERQGDTWLISFPNFAEKQGFGARNGAGTGDPSSSSSSSSTTKRTNPRDRSRVATTPQEPKPPIDDHEGVSSSGQDVDQKVEEIRTRLRDQSTDARNLAAIVRAVPWDVIEPALTDAWMRYRDQLVTNPSAYFVGVMRSWAEESGVDLGLRPRLVSARSSRASRRASR